MIDIKLLHTIIDEAVDDAVFNKITHEQFFKILEKAEIDLDVMSAKKKKNDFIMFHRFNFVLKELHETEEVNMTDACIYILSEMLAMKDLLCCLNEENKYILRTSLAVRNNISMKKSSLDVHMYKRKKSPKI